MATIAAPAPTAAVGRKQALNLGVQIVVALALLVLFPIIFGMRWENFQPLLRPDSLRFLSIGAFATMIVSLAAIVVSLPIATGLALGRLATQPLIRWPCIAFIEVVRSLPLLLLIFYINLRVPGLGVLERMVTGDGYGSLVIGQALSRAGLTVMIALTVYTAAVNAELLRSGILSLDRGQTEAARSLGLTYWQAMRLVILPQAFRRIFAPLIAQFTILLKDSSLGAVIGFIELLRRAQILFQQDFNPMEALYVVALIYFVLNYALGLASRLIERRRPSVHVPLSEV